MDYKRVNLHDVYENLPVEQEALLDCYIPPNYRAEPKPRPNIVIVPGGGYGFNEINSREGIAIGLKFLAEGYNVFILQYSVQPVRFPQQLLELSCAVDYVRSLGEESLVDVDRVAVCGFSAGGHLAGSLGVYWQEEFVYEKLGIEKGSCRPNKLLLCYPVVLSNEYAHQGSVNNLLGENPTQEMLDTISLDKHVTSDMPDTFIWHTYDDQTVPVENSMMMALVLAKEKIPCEAHFYQKGAHALGLGKAKNADFDFHINEHASAWVTTAMDWLEW